MAEDEPLLTTTEAAKALSLGRSTLTLWVRQGHITPDLTTPGGHARWRLSTLKRQLDDLRAKSRQDRSTLEQETSAQRERDLHAEREADRNRDGGR